MRRNFFFYPHVLTNIYICDDVERIQEKISLPSKVICFVTNKNVKN